jgi:hypothetical protein
MPSFPLMAELPKSMDTTGWSWVQISKSGHASDGFWIGTDPQGNRWLTKLRGSFYAYREIVFAQLAQNMGWSCQSSVFIRLDAESARNLGRKANEIHAAHWFLEEHPHPPCRAGCALQPLAGHEVRAPNDLLFPEIAGLIDWPKSEIAAYVFGGNEPPGRLFTLSHELVVIDSEQMFSTSPCDFSNSSWLQQEDGEASPSGLRMAKQVCQDISGLTPAAIQLALTIPPGFSIELGWPIASYIHAGIQFATDYVRSAAEA